MAINETMTMYAPDPRAVVNKGITKPVPLGSLIDPVSAPITGRNAPVSNVTTTAPPPKQEEPGFWGRLVAGGNSLTEKLAANPAAQQALIRAGATMMQTPGSTAQGVGTGINAGLSEYNTRQQQALQNQLAENQDDRAERGLGMEGDRLELARQRLASEEELMDFRKDQFTQQQQLAWEKHGLDKRIADIRADALRLQQENSNLNSKEAGIAASLLESWVAAGKIKPEEKDLFRPQALERASQFFSRADNERAVSQMYDNIAAAIFRNTMPGEDLPEPEELAQMLGTFSGSLRAATGLDQDASGMLELDDSTVQEVRGSLQTGDQQAAQQRGDAALEELIRKSNVNWQALPASERAEILMELQQQIPNWKPDKWLIQ